MAPMPEPLNEQALEPDFKRQKRHYHHHHTTVKQASEIPYVDQVDHQLRRAIAVVLKQVGFEDARPEALESFQLVVEEYMEHFLKYVRTSMVGARRIQPVPFDFEFALHSHQFTLRSLLPHLDPPVKEILPLYAEPAISNDDARLLEMFSTGLDGPQTRLAHAPARLPLLPSRHTYKSTAAFMPRERDPRVIRERATEEGRMGEEALRRLMTGKEVTRREQKKIWQDTMEAMASLVEESPDMPEDTTFRIDLTRPPVNAERAYWRKPVRAEGT